MTSRMSGFRTVPITFWVLAGLAIAIWSMMPGYVVGWDLHVHAVAIGSLRAGHDPYRDGIAMQQAFRNESALHPHAAAPFMYVYSPITLVLLRWIGRFPLILTGTLYWPIYAAGVLGALWVGMQAVEGNEQRTFAMLAPVAVFFPGLLQNDALFSGNIAYVLYGLILVAALAGWRRGRWWGFYAAVLVASCYKAPMLSLLAIPILSARRQWLATGLTAAAGVTLFALQPLLWPSAFHNFLAAIGLMFSYDHDFSSSPAGLLADALYNVVPYQKTSTVFYLAYALVVFGTLLYLRKRFLEGRFSLEQWIPAMLVGTLLLNPRINEYDVAPLTLPMALIAWRVFDRLKTHTQAVVGMSIFFAIVNGLAMKFWKVTEGFLLASLFAAGTWLLLSQQADGRVEPDSA